MTSASVGQPVNQIGHPGLTGRRTLFLTLSLGGISRSVSVSVSFVSRYVYTIAVKL